VSELKKTKSKQNFIWSWILALIFKIDIFNLGGTGRSPGEG